MMANKSKRFLMMTVSLSMAALALTSNASADDGLPIAVLRADAGTPGAALAKILPRLQPFEADEITVYAQRLATLSPASAATEVPLAELNPTATFTVRSAPSFRLTLPIDKSIPGAGLGDAPAGFASEVSVAAGSDRSGIDIGIAQHTRLQSDAGGDRISHGAEVRIGQRLRGLVAAFEQPTWDRPAWYFFAASDGQALTWAPTTNGARVQDRVTIGDRQAGISIQASGLQASLTYVEREVSNAQRSDRQSFTGVAITLRR